MNKLFFMFMASLYGFAALGSAKDCVIAREKLKALIKTCPKKLDGSRDSFCVEKYLSYFEEECEKEIDPVKARANRGGIFEHDRFFMKHVEESTSRN